MNASSASSNLNCLILYGSFARGDKDSNSDIDLCVIIKDEGDIDDKQIENLISEYDADRINLTTYTDAQFDLMLKAGSLFIWHLKYEGKVLVGSEYFNKKTERLKPFTKHCSEILYHKKILSDLMEAKEQVGSVTNFDLALLFTIARNTCIVLCHKVGEPRFGRYDCFQKVKELFPSISLSMQDYRYLSACKIRYDRGVINTTFTNPPHESDKYFEITESLCDFARKKC